MGLSTDHGLQNQPRAVAQLRSGKWGGHSADVMKPGKWAELHTNVFLDEKENSRVLKKKYKKSK